MALRRPCHWVRSLHGSLRQFATSSSDKLSAAAADVDALRVQEFNDLVRLKQLEDSIETQLPFLPALFRNQLTIGQFGQFEGHPDHQYLHGPIDEAVQAFGDPLQLLQHPDQTVRDSMHQTVNNVTVETGHVSQKTDQEQRSDFLGAMAMSSSLFEGVSRWATLQSWLIPTRENTAEAWNKAEVTLAYAYGFSNVSHALRKHLRGQIADDNIELLQRLQAVQQRQREDHHLVCMDLGELLYKQAPRKAFTDAAGEGWAPDSLENMAKEEPERLLKLVSDPACLHACMLSEALLRSASMFFNQSAGPTDPRAVLADFKLCQAVWHLLTYRVSVPLHATGGSMPELPHRAVFDDMVTRRKSLADRIPELLQRCPVFLAHAEWLDATEGIVEVWSEQFDK